MSYGKQTRKQKTEWFLSILKFYWGLIITFKKNGDWLQMHRSLDSCPGLLLTFNDVTWLKVIPGKEGNSPYMEASLPKPSSGHMVWGVSFVPFPGERSSLGDSAWTPRSGIPELFYEEHRTGQNFFKSWNSTRNSGICGGTRLADWSLYLVPTFSIFLLSHIVISSALWERASVKIQGIWKMQDISQKWENGRKF